MKGWGVLILTIAFASTCSADVFFTEIFSNPVADESLNEWIEISNDGDPVDLREWMIGDGRQNDSLSGGMYRGEGSILLSGQSAIITDDMTRVYHNFNASPGALPIYVGDASIGKGGLPNSGGELFLFWNSSLMDTVSFPALSDGISFSLQNKTGSWGTGQPSPGFFIPKADEITVNATNSSLPEIDSCDYAVELEYNLSSYKAIGDLQLRMTAFSVEDHKTNITGILRISDIYGRGIKAYAPFKEESVTRQRSSPIYNPELNLDEAYLLTANISTACIDISLENNMIEVLLLPEASEQQNESLIEITNVYDLGKDKKASYGQILRVRFLVYKGDTRKTTLKSWIERDGVKISKETQVNIDDRFSNQTLTVPIQIFPNCKREHPMGEAFLIVEGFDTKAKESFLIEGVTDSLCEKVEVEKKARESAVGISVLEMPAFIMANQTFGVLVLVQNTNQHEIKAELWSYVYRGGKQYSTGENRKYLTLQPNESRIVRLENTVLAAAGNYSLKVRILKEGRKTTDDLMRDISVKATEIEPKKRISEETFKQNGSERGLPKVAGFASSNIASENHETNATPHADEVIYESQASSSRNSIPYFVGFFVLLAVIFALIRS